MAIAQEDISVGRTVSMRISEWQELARRSDNGSASREVVRIVREYLAGTLRQAPTVTSQMRIIGGARQ